MAAPRSRQPSPFEKFVAPRPLFLGIAVAFLGCCLLGRWAGSVNWYDGFHRFHKFINTETLYFPTASQVRALGRETLEPDRVAVVIGGNSVLLGVGQREERLWTRRLQELLGDRYRVLNLATPGANAWEFGGLAAEMLARDRRRLVFVTCIRVGDHSDSPDGRDHRHFFWEAYYKGLVPADPARDRWVEELPGQEDDDAALPDLRLRMALDGVVYANDLWTAVAHRHLNTIWTEHLSPDFLRPRRLYPDPGVPRRAADHPRPAATDTDLLVWRAERCDGDKTASCCHGAFSADLRARTCVLLVRQLPRRVERLEPSLRHRYESTFPQAVAGREARGFAAAEVGREFTSADYHDLTHLNESGGAKLAVRVADEVRELALRLGYLEQESRP
jgi:hypothetical protein